LTFNQGGASRRPAVYLDHVLVPVADLEAAAQRLLTEYGLRALAGGRHPGAGSANMIVPLGRTYLELIAVVDQDEAQSVPRSLRVAEAAREGRAFATWAARTDDLEAARSALAGAGYELPPPVAGSRRRPDGVLLEWRSQETSRGLEPSVLPFLIEWRVPRGAHPAEAPVEHPSGAGDIVFARFTAPQPEAARARLEWLLDGHLDFEVDAGEREALTQVALAAPGGRLLYPRS
jgi:hypothetical protein